MSRKIILGDNSQYIEAADSVIQNNYMKRSNPIFAENISDSQWQDFLRFVEGFMQSKESKELSEPAYQQLKTEVATAKQENRSAGWGRLRMILSDSANIATILTPIVSYIVANSDHISQWIKNIFM